jgi:HK97 family phage major capsid protein
MANEYGLESLLGTFAQRAIQNKVSAYLALGAGTTEPTGAFTAAIVTAGKTAASQTTIAVDEWVDLMKSIPKGARKGARIVASDVAHTELLKAKSGMGDYLLDTVDGGGYSFAGAPLYTEPQADQTSMSTGEVHVVAGDWSSFFVRMTPMYFKRTDGDDPLNPLFTFAIWMDSNLVGPDLRSLKMA